jgi:hypothetical protein
MINTDPELCHTLLNGLKESSLDWHPLPGNSVWQSECSAHGTVRVFRQKSTLEVAIGSHACSLEAYMRATDGIPPGSQLLLPVGTVNCVETVKAAINTSPTQCKPPALPRTVDHRLRIQRKHCGAVQASALHMPLGWKLTSGALPSLAANPPKQPTPTCFA